MKEQNRIDRDNLSQEDGYLVAMYGEDIDLAGMKRALVWLWEIDRPDLTGDRALALLKEANDAHRAGESGFFDALERLTRKSVDNGKGTKFLPLREAFSYVDSSSALPVEAHLYRHYFLYPGRRTNPAFHEVKEAMLTAGIKVDDRTLRRAIRRVGLVLTPSRGWRPRE